ncbi:MAG: phosphoenolpyruvate carboxylase [Candidatus Caldarchaeum sp.]|nr:phosphoenolpyruvate carboxylase [Candidatus Caldarchaeum sp.]MDW8062972.1 phosphoenolpyruvate carboxylase [Candidatus Caldarchaeum sp.]MDW8434944.1 phosphoenolpyruvate carboxylase [Candidatus Caldarchaeum sp.]
MVEREEIIPKTMSSQHPDNVSRPPWLDKPMISGDDEVEEVFQSWARLGCMEAMWDAEGKDVDLNVVRKLLTKHGDFFQEKLIGRDYFLTYRIPNPYVETGDRKVFFETLQSIPKHYDVCQAFYRRDIVPPVFEVILPFTKSVHQMVQVYNTYRRAVVQLEDVFIDYPDVRLRDVIGKIYPEKIEVIPLFEDLESILGIETIVGRFIELISPRYMRVFIARSDPALNNGLVAATLMAKIALEKVSRLRQTTGIGIHPIIGVGTLPFRGGLNPFDVEKFLKEYGAVSTATVQSAFRYDYPHEKVVEAIEMLNHKLPMEESLKPTENEDILAKVVHKASAAYRVFAETAAPSIARVSALVPARRMRKLHIGAFAYSRRIGNVELPRAIPYACSLYSLGLPPELIGLRFLQSLSEEEYDLLTDAYVTFLEDLKKVAPLVCFENINLLLGGEADSKPELKPLTDALPYYVEDLETLENMLNIKPGPRTLSDRKHSNIVNNFLISFITDDERAARDELLQAAELRRCLG